MQLGHVTILLTSAPDIVQMYNLIAYYQYYIKHGRGSNPVDVKNVVTTIEREVILAKGY